LPPVIFAQMLTRFIQSRYFFLTLWFLAYFIWVQPLVLAHLSQAPEEKNIILGLMLVGVQILELIGVWLKFPTVAARIEANRSQSWAQLGIILLVMTHIFITALLAITTIKLFGIDFDDSGLFNGLAALAIFFAALIKEGFFLAGGFRLMGAKSYRLPPIPQIVPPHIVEIIGDGLLAVFSALAYTVTWEQIASGSPIGGGSISDTVVEYLGAMLLFFMVFPATRILYYTEELLTQRPRIAVLGSWALLLITMCAAIAAIPKA
jgi:hypothetical protein